MPQPIRRLRRPAPFATRDVRRVAEYFDGELEATYVFVQSVWLPDAFKSVDALTECLGAGDASASLFNVRSLAPRRDIGRRARSQARRI